METARHNPFQFNTTESAIRPFIVAMQTIEAQIIAAQSFRVRSFFPNELYFENVTIFVMKFYEILLSELLRAIIRGDR